MHGTLLLMSVVSLGSAVQIAPVERNVDEICTRNDGMPGYCVKLGNCSFIEKLLEKKRQGTSISPNETKYIINSRCNDNKKGYVCCEDKVLEGIQELSTNKCNEFSVIKVFGAHEVQIMSRPWMALLKFRRDFGGEEFTCGGTIINKRFILTAAHCFNTQKLLFVRLGEHQISTDKDCRPLKGAMRCAPPAQDIEAERVFIHENYLASSKHNDIALVKLKIDINLSTDGYKPICLPVNKTLQQSAENHIPFVVTGWGRTENGSGSDILLETNVSRKEREFCQSVYYRQIRETQLCAGDRGMDSCDGDSGGPLAKVDNFNGRHAFVQFGIVSFGSSRCGDGSPGVYTNIVSFIPWIAHKIATK